MITKKSLEHNVKFWETECDKFAKLYFNLEKENKKLKEFLIEQEKETEKYKTLYLQMIETNLKLAEKVGVVSE